MRYGMLYKRSNAELKYCVAFAALCLVVLFLPGCAIGCADNVSTTPKPVYEMPDRCEPRLYIDVSAWNESIDWAAVKSSGVTGAIIRISRYNIDIDPYFDINYKAAKENGMHVGCYYFMNAQNEEQAREDARRLIFIIEKGGYEFDLPVFYDVEDEHDGSATVSHLRRNELTAIIRAFCEEMLSEGYYAGYYSSLNFARNHYYPEQLEKYPFWLASWKNEIYGNEYPNITMWQMSADGSIDGVDGSCDINRCFVDFPSYIKKKGYNDIERIEAAPSALP